MDCDDGCRDDGCLLQRGGLVHGLARDGARAGSGYGCGLSVDSVGSPGGGVGNLGDVRGQGGVAKAITVGWRAVKVAKLSWPRLAAAMAMAGSTEGLKCSEAIVAATIVASFEKWSTCSWRAA